jgi:hypothetical protein
MNLPYIAIVTDAKRVDLNRVFDAMGYGPETFIRKCCAPDPSATTATPPTHWLSSNASASDALVATLQAMTAGDLPALPDGVVWGENGVITAADAMAASNGSALHVYSAAGQIEPAQHAAAVLVSEGLQYVPDPAV